MPRPAADLRELVDAVEIHSGGTFSIAAERFDAAMAAGASDDLASRLAGALYSRKYCRPTLTSLTPAGSDPRAARVLVEQLSHDNSGLGTWEAGWTVDAIDPDGTLVVRRQRDDLLVWARQEEFRSLTGVVHIGGIGRVRVAKEAREMLPGYYVAYGNADRGRDEGPNAVDIVRFYWHLTAEGAREWMRELTARFNVAGVPFQAKVLNDPAAYGRADAGVLYVERAHVGHAMKLLPELHRVTRAGLRDTTPMLTKRLAPGLAAADDPGDGRSFGQHRCQLVAEGLVRACGGAKTRRETRLKAVLDRFADEGLSGATPWLRAGAKDVYQWP